MSVGEKAAAQAMGKEIISLKSHPGWALFYKYYLKEIEKARDDILHLATEQFDDPAKLAMELKYRQGFYDGVVHFAAFVDELMNRLDDGQLPGR